MVLVKKMVCDDYKYFDKYNNQVFPYVTHTVQKLGRPRGRDRPTDIERNHSW